MNMTAVRRRVGVTTAASIVGVKQAPLLARRTWNARRARRIAVEQSLAPGSEWGWDHRIKIGELYIKTETPIQTFVLR